MPTLGKSFAFIDKVNMLLRQNLEPCSLFFLGYGQFEHDNK